MSSLPSPRPWSSSLLPATDSPAVLCTSLPTSNTATALRRPRPAIVGRQAQADTGRYRRRLVAFPSPSTTPFLVSTPTSATTSIFELDDVLFSPAVSLAASSDSSSSFSSGSPFEYDDHDDKHLRAPARILPAQGVIPPSSPFNAASYFAYRPRRPVASPQVAPAIPRPPYKHQQYQPSSPASTISSAGMASPASSFFAETPIAWQAWPSLAPSQPTASSGRPPIPLVLHLPPTRARLTGTKQPTSHPSISKLSVAAKQPHKDDAFDTRLRLLNAAGRIDVWARHVDDETFRPQSSQRRDGSDWLRFPLDEDEPPLSDMRRGRTGELNLCYLLRAARYSADVSR